MYIISQRLFYAIIELPKFVSHDYIYISISTKYIVLKNRELFVFFIYFFS